MNFSVVALFAALLFKTLAKGALGSCGNGVCDVGESCLSCPLDCISNYPVCGNGVCEEGEDCINCNNDCNFEDSDETRGIFCCYGGDKGSDNTYAVSCADIRCSARVGKCAPKPVAYCCG